MIAACLAVWLAGWMVSCLVGAAEQGVVLGLLFAVWVNTNLCCDWLWLVGWYAQGLGAHGWSALFNDGVSGRVLLELVLAVFASAKWRHDHLLGVQAGQKVWPALHHINMALQIGFGPF